MSVNDVKMVRGDESSVGKVTVPLLDGDLIKLSTHTFKLEKIVGDEAEHGEEEEEEEEEDTKVRTILGIFYYCLYLLFMDKFRNFRFGTLTIREVPWTFALPPPRHCRSCRGQSQSSQ